MNQQMEIKYQKFIIHVGQKLTDLPAYHRMQQRGWRVTWSYRQEGLEESYIETLLQRSFEKQAGTSAEM